MQIRRWHYFDNVGTLQLAVIRRIEHCAAEALATRGRFHCVLAGGRTPESIYRELRALRTDWSRWSIYFGDERCLPAGDAQRNDTMARKAWLDHVPLDAQHIHSIPAEQGPVIAAEHYAAALATVQEFDLVLLGLGEDGHTASLFPNDPALQSSRAAIAIHDSPKPPPERVSMSADRLARSRHVLFIVAGDDKRDALLQWHRDAYIPAALIAPPGGVDIYTDQRVE